MQEDRFFSKTGISFGKLVFFFVEFISCSSVTLKVICCADSECTTLLFKAGVYPQKFELNEFFELGDSPAKFVTVCTTTWQLKNKIKLRK